MVPLTSNTKKVCDVSRTIVYRANSPHNICTCEWTRISFDILPTNVIGGVSNIYSTMQSMQGKFLRTNQSIKPNSLQTLETSPPLASIAKMGGNG
jgi:hypothetical protein